MKNDNPIKLLLVEDNRGDARLIEALLAENGLDFELTWVDRLASGLECLKRESFDVLLLDLGLPDSQGLHTLTQTLTEASALPIVLLTGLDDKTIASAALQSGAQDYLVKGQVTPDLLERSLRYAVERKRTSEALRKAQLSLQEYAEQLEEMVATRTKELHDAQEQLMRREKLAILGQLAGSIGHDLRNPLGAIKNAVYYLNMRLEALAPDVQEMLGILNLEINNSERIINSLLNYARTKAPNRQPLHINEVIQEALSQSTMAEDVVVTCQLNENLPTILADPDQLRQVFSNLIQNGIQAMSSTSSAEIPDGGQLTIKTEVLNADWVAISFTDTGVGIPEKDREKLFEPLFTTKAKGIGLGLALVKTLVEGHNGRVEVQSDGVPGKGSVFTIKLPLIEVTK